VVAPPAEEQAEGAGEVPEVKGVKAAVEAESRVQPRVVAAAEPASREARAVPRHPHAVGPEGPGRVA
jgi:hypothetical protein